jgi:hypothetical protein
MAVLFVRSGTFCCSEACAKTPKRVAVSPPMGRPLKPPALQSPFNSPTPSLFLLSTAHYSLSSRCLAPNGTWYNGTPFLRDWHIQVKQGQFRVSSFSGHFCEDACALRALQDEKAPFLSLDCSSAGVHSQPALLTGRFCQGLGFCLSLLKTHGTSRRAQSAAVPRNAVTLWRKFPPM